MATDDDDEEYGPESDPYCAHLISIFDDRHPASLVLCENCGQSCHEHPYLGGAWCPTAEEGTPNTPEHHWKNASWPAGFPVKSDVVGESK